MRIQHNIMAMNAYRNYNTNTKALSGNLEKLSSGYKINRAGDDAAGLAISEKMRAQITGLDAAQKNVKDGISLVKTAEGAMQEIQDMLNRMDYLATQSANGTYDNDVDRANLQKEVDALKTEINRIADSANFNGIKLLDGSQDGGSSNVSFQDATVSQVLDGAVAKDAAKGKYEVDLSKAEWIAAKDGGTVKVTIAGTTAAAVTATSAGDKVTGADLASNFLTSVCDSNGDIEINGKTFTVTHDGNGKLTFTGKDYVTMTTTSALDVAVAVSATGDMVQVNSNGAAGNQAYVQAFTQLEEPVPEGRPTAAQCKVNLADLNIKDGTTIKIGGETYTFALGKESKFKDAKNVVDLTDMETVDNSKAAARLSGVANSNKSAFVESKVNDSYIYLTEKLGGLDRESFDVTGASETALTDATWKGEGGSFVQFGDAPASNGKGLTLQIGDTADKYNQLKLNIGDMHVKAMGIASVDISDQDGAASAIADIRAAINYVSSVRGDLGAVQNRLEHTGNNLSVMAENIQDAESTIRDTDVANEMMSYVKNNILVQSAQAMLAQANQVPQGVLQLLG